MKEIKAYQLSDGTLVIDQAEAVIKQLNMNKRALLLRFCQQFLYDPFDTFEPRFDNSEELAELLLKHQDELFAALDQNCDSINIKPLQP